MSPFATLPSHPSKQPDAWKNLGINAGVVAVAAWLLRRDLKARGTAVNRVMREGQLGACEVQLQNGRRLRLADLRWAGRDGVCLVPKHVREWVFCL